MPVKIRRLKEDWKFDAPDRIPEQKRLQQAILQLEKHDVDFSGWTQQRYAEELTDAAKKTDALTAFNARKFLATLNQKSPQYKVDKYLPKLAAILSNYRSPDIRTMYVGVTAANIFLGDANYVFNASQQTQTGMASILSYSVMLAQTLNELGGSRKRLAERIAKELVPASLKALNIPRPSDPTDPYSYSDGIARLDQKTLKLSNQGADRVGTLSFGTITDAANLTDRHFAITGDFAACAALAVAARLASFFDASPSGCTMPAEINRVMAFSTVISSSIRSARLT